MPRQLDYEILDVFSNKPFSGNPLALVELKQDIPQSLKQQIAKEFNLSETVFWHTQTPATAAASSGTRIDIFTPDAEIPFAGHPTIGSAFSILRQSGRTNDVLQMKAGAVPIRTGQDDDEDERGYVYAEVPHNVHRHVVQPIDGAQVVSIVKGMTFVLIQLDSLEKLGACDAVVEFSVNQLDEGWREGLQGTYYWYQDPSNRTSIRTRLFLTLGASVIEDAATGSAACALASHLSRTWQTESLHLRITQGVEMGRSSNIVVKTQQKDGKLTGVTLGGTAVSLMKGVINI